MDYVKRLMFGVFHLIDQRKMSQNDGRLQLRVAPHPLAFMYERPDKNVAIQELRSCFNQQEE